jgi:hypothetical protein
MLGLAAAVGAASAAQAATTAGDGAQASLILVQNTERAGRDCTPYNGPFGFYGNVWCQPPSEQSYLRNLGSRWPQETPPSLRKPKPHDTGSDW